MRKGKSIVPELDIGELVENSNAISYLKASPMESGERSALDKALTEDYFYEYFYVHSEKSETRIKQVKKQILRNDIDGLVLSGSRGCGKSTFINFFLRQAKISNIMINFDDNWEPDVGIKKNIIMALNNRIYNDLFPLDEEESCRIIYKYLQIFGRDKGFCLEKNDMDNYFSCFSDKLQHIYHLKRDVSNDDNLVLRFYGEDIRKHTIEGTIKQVIMLLIFWNIAENIDNNVEGKCLIVLENLDVIYNTEDVFNIVKNLFSLRRELARVGSIYYRDKQIRLEQNYIPLLVVREDTKSEITRAASVMSHFTDEFRITSIDITGLYSQNEIIKKRFRCIEQYLTKNPQYRKSVNFMQVYNSVKSIGEILSDTYLNFRLSEMLDYDYSACAELLGGLVSNDKNFVLECKRMLAFDEKEQMWSVFGLHSIVFRRIFNLFMQEQYFANVQRFEYVADRKGIICKINLDRMILLYLSNCTDKEKIVPLNILFGELEKFCQLNDAIVDALWQMYDMRRKYQWNNLIAFTDMCNITYEELTREMRAFVYKESFYHFAGVKITKAGETYLNYILPHFEYYAARCRGGQGKSLFAMTAEEVCTGQEFDQLLKDEMEEIGDCCQKLYLFFNNVFGMVEEFRGQKFLETDFATTVKFGPYNKTYKMFYCERNIYANIEYLDKLRLYIFEILDRVFEEGGFCKEIDIRKTISVLPQIEHNLYKMWSRQIPFDNVCCRLKKRNLQSTKNTRMQIILLKDREVEVPLKNVIIVLKACLNVRLTEAICSFMGMFGLYGRKKRTMYSENMHQICNALDACINKIRRTGFIDFTTKIDIYTGEHLLKK